MILCSLAAPAARRMAAPVHTEVVHRQFLLAFSTQASNSALLIWGVGSAVPGTTRRSGIGALAKW